MMTILRLIGDTGFYLTLGGVVGTLFGAPVGTLMLLWAAIIAAAGLGLLLRKAGPWRIGPLLPVLPAGWALGAGWPALVALLPAWGYALYALLTNRGEGGLYDEQAQFSLYWKGFLILALLMAVLGAGENATRALMSIGAVTLIGMVSLLRALRHDSATRASWRFQLSNLISVGAAALIAAFLGSGTFFSFIKGTVSLVLRYIVSPVVMAVVWLVYQIARGAGALLGLLGVRLELEPMDISLNTFTAEEMFGPTESRAIGGFPAWIFPALGVLLGLAVVALIWRYLASRDSGGGAEGGVIDRREILSDQAATRREENDAPHAAKVRAAYRKYLKICEKRGLRRTRAFTSQDVRDGAAVFAPEGENGRLREVYIRARYGGKADQADADEARALSEAIAKYRKEG